MRTRENALSRTCGYVLTDKAIRVQNNQQREVGGGRGNLISSSLYITPKTQEQTRVPGIGRKMTQQQFVYETISCCFETAP